ncbi:hypothetical protein BS78_07G212200 [Paspalum vaginatum]|nr:hypothetical protein BS78_07G212200 [Paspalum vaginatum]
MNNSPNDSTIPMPIPIDEILPAVVDAEKNEMVLHEVPVMVDMKQHQNMSEPLAVAPLRMVPFGGKRPVPFSEHALARLKEQKLGHCSRQQEVEIPPWLKKHELYVAGDWRAFTKSRGGGRSDWTFVHKGYRRKFRSSCEVDQFLRTKETTEMFKGRKLQKMKTDDSVGQCTGTPFLLISIMLYF